DFKMKKYSISSNDVVTLEIPEESMGIENREKMKHFWIIYKSRQLLLTDCLNEKRNINYKKIS
ncbi:hypothetical protein MERGE_001350, partial [Pneumocystis wakefieldiae]